MTEKTIYDPDETYLATTENLTAVISGLDVNMNDTVLGVSASGDQTFAMLEKAKVIGVDNQRLQIQFANERLEMLRSGDYQRFLFPVMPQGELQEYEFEQRNSYFQENGRLDRIRDNIENIRFVETDIFDALKTEQGISKVYLSNALGYGPCPDIRSKITMLVESVPKDGLVYIANAERISSILNPRQCSPNYDLHSRLVMDKELSKAARDHELDWTPIVFRKI